MGIFVRVWYPFGYARYEYYKQSISHAENYW